MEQKNKGITLIALVITIIILLILAGITIATLTGENGLFARAKQAKEETEKAQVDEKIKLALLEATIESETGSANYSSIEDYIEILNKQEGIDIETQDSEEYDKEIVMNDKYVYGINQDENGEIKTEYIGIVGKLLPSIKLVNISNTTNTISIEVTTKRNEGGKLEYYIKEEGETEYTLKSSQEGTQYTYEGLTQDKKYNIKVVAIAPNGEKAELLVDRTFIELKDANSETKLNYKFGEATFQQGSGAYWLTKIEYNGVEYGAGDMIGRMIGDVIKVNPEIYGIIVYNDTTYAEKGYYRFIATSTSSGNSVITYTSAWEYLGESYLVTQ